MQAFDAGALSILPPIVAIILALWTKEVFSSLLIGIFTGTFIYSVGLAIDGGPIIGSAQTAFAIMVERFDLNIVLFCSLLGSLVYVISLAGGSKAYGKWAITHIKGRRSAMVSTSLLGAFIFVDDYFNCLTVGTVMRPITDSYKISRAKLAYIIDATAAPICIIAPISSWAAAVGSNLKNTNAFETEMGAFIATIPWNFYAILCLAMVLLLAFTNLDFGPMRKAELEVLEQQPSDDAANLKHDNLEPKENGTVMDMVLPIVSLIILATCSLLFVGGYWGEDEQYHSIGAAFGNTDAGPALAMGAFGALLVSCMLFVGRRLLTLKEFMEGCLRGVQAMVPACMILTLAWTISGVCRDLLQTQLFIAQMVEGSSTAVGSLLPATIFLVAGFLSFSTGTAWGTFGILIPIVISVCEAIAPSSHELVVITLSATLAGSVFGDHSSPISDTTILSSAGAGCPHLDHVYTQVPYAVVVASAAFLGYIVAGFTYSLFYSFSVAAVVLFTTLIYLHSKKQNA